MKRDVSCIILAAGKGERMKSSIPKVMHPLCGRPMLFYVLDLVKALNIKRSVTVIGHKWQEVLPQLPLEVKTVVQKKQLGTADAVKAALPALKAARGAVLILYGDIPLLKKDTVTKLIDFHLRNRPAATVLTSTVTKPAGYGRIIRDQYASISGIVEDKDVDDFQKKIKEVNTGIICFGARALSRVLKDIRANNSKREFYLTDAIGLLHRRQELIEGVALEDANESLGINSRVELEKATRIMQSRINEAHMKKGVTIVDSSSTFIGFGAAIGEDTTVYPCTVIEQGVRVGKRCAVGPFVHLREGTFVDDECSIGNFLEMTRSRVAPKTFIKHFGYIGDARIGAGVNIGAGTVTANFDGARKGMTVIKEGAFIGSDTVLVAPVIIGRRARTGAGAVVVKHQDVPDGATVVGVPARALNLQPR